jgi:hypothetical protein
MTTAGPGDCERRRRTWTTPRSWPRDRRECREFRHVWARLGTRVAKISTPRAGPEPEEPPRLQGFSDGASRTRTGGLLGAIRARAVLKECQFAGLSVGAHREGRRQDARRLQAITGSLPPKTAVRGQTPAPELMLVWGGSPVPPGRSGKCTSTTPERLSCSSASTKPAGWRRRCRQRACRPGERSRPPPRRSPAVTRPLPPRHSCPQDHGPFECAVRGLRPGTEQRSARAIAGPELVERRRRCEVLRRRSGVAFHRPILEQPGAWHIGVNPS